MPYSYHRAGPDDFLAIAELDRLAWGDADEDRYIPDGEHAWRLWVEYGFVDACTDTSGAIVGASLAFPATPEEHGKLLAVHKLMVHPDHRDRGLGTALFERLTSFADRNGYAAFLSVKPHNESAKAVYRKLGFAQETLEKGYYRPDEDRLIMRREPR